MLLKNHLIEVFKKASSENNILLKENIVIKWVHRFGIDSLNDLLINIPVLRENQHEEENQEQIKLKLLKTADNLYEKKLKSNSQENSMSNKIFSKNRGFDYNSKKLPLPYIENLRRWINNDKKAS